MSLCVLSVQCLPFLNTLFDRQGRPSANWTNFSQLGPALELSTLSCSSTNNNTHQVLQRTIGSQTSQGNPGDRTFSMERILFYFALNVQFQVLQLINNRIKLAYTYHIPFPYDMTLHLIIMASVVLFVHLVNDTSINTNEKGFNNIFVSYFIVFRV